MVSREVKNAFEMSSTSHNEGTGAIPACKKCG